MKFTCDTTQFKNALTKVYTISDTASLGTTKNVTLRLRGDALEFGATDLIHFIKTQIDCTSDCTEPVVFLLNNTKILINSIKYFTDSTINFTYDSDLQKLTMVCGGKTAIQTVVEGELFHYSDELEDFGDPTESLSYSNLTLKQRYNSIKYAVSKASTPEVTPYQGVCFEGPHLIATDGHRLAMSTDCTLQIDNPFILLEQTLKYITTLMDTTISIQTTKNHCYVCDGTTHFVARLLDGKFLDVTKYFETSFTDELNPIDVRQLKNTIDYLLTYKYKDMVPIITCQNNTFTIDNANGKLESVLDVDLKLPQPIMFNARYLKDALSQFSGDVYVQLNNCKNSLVLTSVTDDSSFALVLLLLYKI